MWLRTSCDFSFDITVPTPFILMLRLRSDMQQLIENEKCMFTPDIPVVEYIDHYGNYCQRLIAQPGPFQMHTSATVKVIDDIDKAPGAPFVDIELLPDDVLHYLLPSRYCESDRFGQMATEIVSESALGYDQVKAIESWLKTAIRYVPGSSDIPLSAVEVNLKQSGVCRDLSHLGIALCRSLSIPARLVVGYLYGLEPMDMHAWFEAYIDGRWYTFDATQAELKGGYVVIGYGRDATDVAIYNQFGPPVFPTSHYVQVELVEEQ